ncbi:putative enoyl-hydratase isomerase family protein [Coleophoma cylindrospora]|uniref:Putative enoyl-hydratase isomerase family protein n=1 Tax=Coleophoma cylindrospora TaxID=1849047 RepID=A0A3D8RGC8_9HELO|nr:putative enoyl-hydratase isomerase family protein [Coleophoma cylindrospora]
MPLFPSSYSSLSFQHIRVSHVPESAPSPTPVILITLYRPKNHNAFTDIMTEDLERAFIMLSLDPRVKAIVVTGYSPPNAPNQIFCAGADLDAGLSYTHDTARTHRDGGGRVALAIHRCTKPVIAAINGSAVGVGITMTLPMNIRIVSNKAKVGFVFARRGIVMEACSSYFLPKLIGLSKAMHLITTGSVYPSTHPLFSELFSEVVEPDQVLARALELADDVAKNTSAVSTHLMKDLMWRNPGTAEATHLLDSKILLELFEGKDKKEGIDSFLQKRAPEFKASMDRDAPVAWPWWQPINTAVPMTMEDVNLKAKL